MTGAQWHHSEVVPEAVVSRMADILLLLCSCRDGVCVWGAQCVTGAPVLVLVQSGMLSAWDSGLPPGFQIYRQADTQQGAVPTSSPQGLSLVCLVETPGRGGGGGQQEQQSPHHCPGGAFLRDGRGATQGTRTAPTSPASTVLLSSPTAFAEQLLGELGGTSVSWRTPLCLLEATPELALSPWGRCPFHRPG